LDITKKDSINERRMIILGYPIKYKQRGIARDATIDPKEIYLHNQTNIKNTMPHSKHETGEIAKKIPRGM